jgi:arginase family enzyme
MNPRKTDSWKVVVLEHDYASEEIGKFFSKIWEDGIIVKKMGKNYDLDHKKKISEEIKNILGILEGKILTLYGSGYYHHYTYGLCDAISRERSKDYTYLHIDNHPDSCYNSNGHIGCGSFVEHILEEPEAKDIILIGPTNNPKERALISQEEIVSKKAKEITRKILREKQQPDVYSSFDLDVLDEKEIETYYNRGILKLKHLLDLIDIMREEKNIISADILGYNGGSSNYANLITYAALAAKLVGKDTKELEKLHNYFKSKRIGYDKAVKKEFEMIIDQLKI